MYLQHVLIIFEQKQTIFTHTYSDTKDNSVSLCVNDQKVQFDLQLDCTISYHCRKRT